MDWQTPDLKTGWAGVAILVLSLLGWIWNRKVVAKAALEAEVESNKKKLHGVVYGGDAGGFINLRRR